MVYCFGYILNRGHLIAKAAFLVVESASKKYKESEYSIVPQDIVDFDISERTKDYLVHDSGLLSTDPIEKVFIHIDASKVIRLCMYEELCNAFARLYGEKVRMIIGAKQHIQHIAYFLKFYSEGNSTVAEFTSKEYSIRVVNTKEFDERVHYRELDCVQSGVKVYVDQDQVGKDFLFDKICKLLRNQQPGLAIYEILMSEIGIEKVSSVTYDNCLDTEIIGRSNLGKYVVEGTDFEEGKLYEIFEGTPGLTSDFSGLVSGLSKVFSEIGFEKCVVYNKDIDDVDREYIE